MTRRDALILRSAAVWTVLIWSVRVNNILGDDDHSVGFKAVHTLLAIVSVVFAFAVWQVASRSRKRGHVA